MPEDRLDDPEERMLILRDKAAREGFAVPADVLDYIAEKYALPQTLKGALINVQAYASRRNIPVTMDVARLVLDGIRPSSDRGGAAEADGLPAESGTLADAAEATSPQPATEPELARVPASEPAPDEPEPLYPPEPEPAYEPEPWASAPASTALEDALEAVLGVMPAAAPEPGPESEPRQAAPPEPDESLFAIEAPPLGGSGAHVDTLFAPAPSPAPASEPAPVPVPGPAVVWFAPVRTSKKESLVSRAGKLLDRVGLGSAIDEDDLVAVKLHFGEEGNTGFVQPVFLREVVRRVREAGGKPFLTDSNTLYRGQRANAVDHLTCAIHNGFSYATVEAPLIIADGLDGRDGVDVPIEGYDHFDSVRIGAAAVHADAMVVVTHVKGHEATGMGGALKNVGMGLGCRSAKQRMHSDLKPQVDGATCTACARCVKWCPVAAIAINPDRVAQIDYELCYGCGECVASCPYGAIAIQWKTEPDALQQKIVEHAAGALAGKEGKTVYLSFVVDVSPDCDCWNFSDASVIPDIGVLASTDIVAIDQAAYDLVVKARGLAGSRGEGMAEGTDKFREITGVDPTLELAYAELHGLGTRSYELRTLD